MAKASRGLRVDQQRLGGGDLGVRFLHDDGAGARVHRQFKVARRLDENEVTGLCVGDAGDSGDLNAAVADEAGSGEVGESFQGLRHSLVIGEWLGKFKTIHHGGTEPAYAD